MKILVWDSYGSISVHCAESEQQLISIADTVISILTNWNVGITFSQIDAAKSLPSGQKKCSALRTAIKELVEYNGEDSDEFESFYFDTVTY